MPRIPLFPLDVVLLPGGPLPLHIFEPRYKLMVRLCLDEKRAFGVVRALPNGIASIGCTAEILELVKSYPDGRMDILTAGRTAFHLKDLFDEQLYTEGEAEFLADDPSDAPAAAPEPLWKLYERAHLLVFGRPPHQAESQPGYPISYQIASELPLDLDLKQELLDLRSEPVRRTHLIEHLERWVPELERRHQARSRAGGNGHGLR